MIPFFLLCGSIYFVNQCFSISSCQLSIPPFLSYPKPLKYHTFEKILIFGIFVFNFLLTQLTKERSYPLYFFLFPCLRTSDLPVKFDAESQRLLTTWLLPHPTLPGLLTVPYTHSDLLLILVSRSQINLHAQLPKAYPPFKAQLKFHSFSFLALAVHVDFPLLWINVI